MMGLQSGAEDSEARGINPYGRDWAVWTCLTNAEIDQPAINAGQSGSGDSGVA
jgi:hypothetical protein